MKEFKDQKKGLMDQIIQLKLDLENEGKKRVHEVNEKEREKLHATEKLRREMLA
jgi:CHASE3 domain sensor protein